VLLRRGIDGGPGATSVPAAAVFTVALLALAALGALRLRRGAASPRADRLPWPRGLAAPVAAATVGRFPSPRRHAAAVAAGLAGAAVLAAGPLVRHLAGPGPVLPLERLPVWAAAVTGVAVAEEVLLRGVLWRAVLNSSPGPDRAPWAALGVTTVAFAVLHVPFYGVGSLPVNLAAGLLLGGLRQWTGTVTAPAVAHLAADLAGWWLQ
jgi:membrane protease YdiL (CAAX protease family)